MRIRFKSGEQRKFLDLVANRLNCVSVRGILERGFDISYDSLKSYYIERRLLPEGFFLDLCHLAKLEPKDFEVGYLDDNWGRVKGGKKSKREGRY